MVSSKSTNTSSPKLNILEFKWKDMLISAKAKYESCLVFTSHTTHPSSTTTYLISQTLTQPLNLLYNSEVVHDPTAKAEIFYIFSNSTYRRSDYNLPLIESLLSLNLQLSVVHFNSSDVFDALIHPNPSKAAGCDDMNSRVLRNYAIHLIEPIAHCFGTCIQCSAFPTDGRST